MLHDVLWRSNFHLAQSCLLHPFVRALGDGTLPADLFRAYIAQTHSSCAPSPKFTRWRWRAAATWKPSPCVPS